MASEQPNRIAEIRRARGLTQAALAKAVNAHTITISKLERGKMQLTWAWADILSDAMSCDPLELYPLSNSKKEVLIVGSLSDGAIISRSKGGEVYETTEISALDDFDSEYYLVETGDLKPFIHPGDFVRLSYFDTTEMPLTIGRLCYFGGSKGEEVFGVLEAVAGIEATVRSLNGRQVTIPEIYDFGVITAVRINLKTSEGKVISTNG